jgi:hypothetical protein
MSTAKATRWNYLAPKSGSAYRQLFIKGRNVAAFTLYCLHVDNDEPGLTAEQIAADYDVPVKAVLEAIAYCESNPPELQRDWEADEALAKAAGVTESNPIPRRLSPQEKACLTGA